LARRQRGAGQRHRAERRAARHAGVPDRGRRRLPRLEDLFAAYTDPATLQFTRTRATIKLATLGKALVSRSEAKRLVAGLPEFRHVTLDFSGVDVVGQGFCDEVFRVFAHAHPDVGLEPVGMNDTVAFMVARARAAAATAGH
jgi:STAS-like domain of unknown function (DUF4325)